MAVRAFEKVAGDNQPVYAMFALQRVQRRDEFVHSV